MQETAPGDLFTRVARPRVCSIAPGAPFLSTLADSLLDGTLIPGFRPDAEPLGLATATIFLPTRRAARALQDILLRRSGRDALLLPRITPLGDVDDDFDLASEPGDAEPPGVESAAGFATALSGEALAPPIPAIERRLILTRLVLGWARQVDRALLRLSENEPLLAPASPADALALAGDLEKLMDQLTTQGVDWDALAAVVAARHSAWFGITLEFLRIVRDAWPAILVERGASDPTLRRHAMLLAEADRLIRQPPQGPMIVAGSTGSAPATARLIAAISRLPRGVAVLPGLDLDLDDASFALVAGDGPTDGKGDGRGDETAFSHPQAMMARLLKVIGVSRHEVTPLGAPPPGAVARRRLLSEALRPASTTELWAGPGRRPDATSVAAALDGVALVEAADEREEALAAAIAIREMLEQPEATVALITPDRDLAERVCADLKRWGVEADDSAGSPLARTGAGRFARLAAEAVASNCAPRQLVALLAHPLVTLGWPRAVTRRVAAAMEIGLLRGPEPPAGLHGLRAILEARRQEANGAFASRPLKRLRDKDWARVAATIDRLEQALAPLREAAASGDLVAMLRGHRQTLLRLAAQEPDGQQTEGPKAEGQEAVATTIPAPFQESADAVALLQLFDDVALAHDCELPGRLEDYPALFAGLANSRMVRSEGDGRGRGAHRRVRIFGLLEARLIEADRVVLGGLDEAVWPPAARTDAFLNRPMAAALGMQPPERRIGQTAHDFVSAMGTRDVVITRAAKRGGAPTVPSRFLQRIRALTTTPGAPADNAAGTSNAWTEALARGQRFLDLVARLEEPPRVAPLRRPAPVPPVELVPRSLSVTEVETLVRDPYAIYARHVLGLDPLDELATPPGASDRGSIIHEAVGKFAETWPTQLPSDPLAELMALGEDAFRDLEAYPDVRAQWWPRFTRIAQGHVRWERQRRPGLDRVLAEVSGRLEIPLGNGDSFTLRGRADRIEIGRDGVMTIVDFKTGQSPTAREVFAGFAPQLTLEAHMLRQGAFPEAPAGAWPVNLTYVQMSGGEPPLTEKPVKPGKDETRSVDDIIRAHAGGFVKLISRYRAGGAAWPARPYAKYARRYNDYDHLARVREWARAGGEDAE
ncbi:double-strand break repair protein AddB [Camelimonas fluminis]|uniref:Double-strand break repair protein AddB n=1 Tax=Camelimonas fluminis TaxID=1576911 RepID=A0ABV7UNC4_9HYPH|nr:double-strand break repair protein AddB [Camelimonas fluminis]GHE69098.1 double-strand break repair protein AddB [Camelimonas fluminis]